MTSTFALTGSDSPRNPDNIIPFQERHWWKEAVVYQIYPASFCDGDGDGWGDIKGITSKLPYLSQLGANVIWLCPIFKSPQHDMGYDISDYRSIHAPYGTTQDVEDMLKAAHDLDLRVILDLVVNHSSNEHEWFLESKSSLNNPKRDWYHWVKGKTGPNGEKLPPNNWKSVFGAESAWQYDETTDEWYLHLFVTQQPDLNWDNPEVREAVYDLMKFWLDKGVDGWRMDVINLISKVAGYPDAPVVDPKAKYQPSIDFVANGPRMHEFLKEMNEKVLSKYDILTVGETPCTHDPKDLIQYVRSDELRMCFHFEMHDLDGTPAGPLENKRIDLRDLKRVIEKWQVAMYEGNGWNSVYYGNHDQARLVTRFCSDAPEYRARSAKLLALNQMTLSGTVYVYQGEDIGMCNMPRDWGFEEYKDIATLQWIQGEKEKRQKATEEENPDLSDLLEQMRAKSRDNARTPVQWDTTKNAGFSTGTPWMRVHDDYKEWNVEVQSKDKDSVNSFYKELFKARNDHLILVYGDFKVLDFENPSVFAYTKTYKDEKVLVILNFSDDAQEFEVDDGLDLSKAKLLLGTMGRGEVKDGKVKLDAWEGVSFTF